MMFFATQQETDCNITEQWDL